MKPLVSICCITYNHAPFIKRCIDGFLLQRTSFPIEILIFDDASTDGTTNILREISARYPQVEVHTSQKNLGAVKNEQGAFLAAQGKYIATCEGDDYWTDPLKLQRQIDFLESHPDYSICFHRYKKYHKATDSWESDGCDNLFSSPTVDGIEISMHQFMHQWCTQYLTMVFRKECYDFDAYKKYKYFRDTHQIYHLMLKWKCYLFSFIGGVYNMTGNGEYSTKSQIAQSQMTLEVDKELWKVNNDIRWKEMCAIVMQNMIDRFSNNAEIRHTLLSYSFQIFHMNLKIKQWLKNIKKIL